MNLINKGILNIGIYLAYLLLVVFSINAIANKFISGPDTADEQELVDDGKTRIKVALLLDTSGSMDGLLSQAKSQLWSIINKLSDATIDNEKPELQIALYEYGNDRLSQENGYIKRITSFTSDVDNISEKLFAMTTNGGSEYCGHVIRKSVDELDWGGNEDDLRLIFIAGNERFDQGNVSYIKAAQKAGSKHIIINPIYCGEFEEGIREQWQNVATMTSGKYMSIEQDRKTVYISSPYDEDILKLNNKLNKTYIPYGSTGKKNQSRQMSQDKNASSYGVVNNVKRAVCKSKSVYNNATWDLVDAAKDEKFDIESIEEESLPEEIQSLSKKELKSYISKKQIDRKSIQDEINQLNVKRQKHVEDQQKLDGTDQSDLGNALLGSIEKQALKRGYKF